MLSFAEQVEKEQVNWRNRAPDLPIAQGEFNGRTYAHILPKADWEMNLWEGIRNGGQFPLSEYLDKGKIKPHDHVHNLKSSWVCCANLYFPFRDDTKLLCNFLRTTVSTEITDADPLELEFLENDPRLSPTALLGEPQGGRGFNQTSPDFGVKVTTTRGKGLVLVECKYTETSFSNCSGLKKEHANPNESRCFDGQLLFDNSDGPEAHCHISQWAKENRANRRYWDILKASRTGRDRFKCCPAAAGGYQLFRQQALAEALARRAPYAFVASCVVYDERNLPLISCLSDAGIENFPQTWGKVFDGETSFAAFTHQSWVQWVREHGQPRWSDWLQYVEDRYGY